MYGSTHTHFESRYDTGNNLGQMIKNFRSLGAKRVAVTEHGAMSSYEDLRDEVNHQAKDAKEAGEAFDFEIIPGVEAYFAVDEEAAKNRQSDHLILIAKDHEGYLELCKIVTEANELVVNGKPITTLQNLRDHVKAGHIVCTSACIAGPFGQLFGLKAARLREKVQKDRAVLERAGYFEVAEIVAEEERLVARRKEISVTKKAYSDAQKIFKRTGDASAVEELDERIAESDRISAYLEENAERFAAASERWNAPYQEGKDAKLKTLARKEAELSRMESELAAMDEEVESGRLSSHAASLYHEFERIFGKDDFYFEIQNHGIPAEKQIYNDVVEFAFSVGNPHFIAANDVHVGVAKSDPAYQDQLAKRNVAKFLRFGRYTAPSPDEAELCIKDDGELREWLLKTIEPHGGMSAEQIVDSAIWNIEGALSSCHIDFPKENHYPKFCENENEAFEAKIREGIALKFPDGFPSPEYEERLAYEIGVIERMGYASYHLIVADYLEYGRLLGNLSTADEIANAPENIEELKAYLAHCGYEKAGYNIGPGRGSAVGSLVCYLMGITDIDPIPYKLYFERFLNVERVSMPDIDSDFRTDIRAKVEDYCRTKYGAECISKIMTKAYAGTKGAIRLAARYLGAEEYFASRGSDTLEDLDEEEDDASRIQVEGDDDTAPSKDDLNEYLRSQGWYAEADALCKMYSEELDESDQHPFDGAPLNDRQRRIVTFAENVVDGIFTGYGQHAAGTIISADDITNAIPLMWNGKKGSMETQCTMAQAEAKGLLKMDFLGLRNLNIITDVTTNPTNPADVDKLLLDYRRRDQMLTDANIYRHIFWAGKTQGIFQFESDGMKKMLMAFRPETFEDIILLVAAYRPGPMQYLDEIIATKQFKDGRIQTPPVHTIDIDNEALKKILDSTYGCIIYQEQVMQIFQQLAGYSLGGADLVRRAMSKKKAYVIEEERDIFLHGNAARIEALRAQRTPEEELPKPIPGCIALQGISEADGSKLYDQMTEFAKYAFNKSHATAYAMVSMFTAYLKEYHTADFFRTVMNYLEKRDSLPAFIAELPYFGIEMRAPSMADSGANFTVEDSGKAIRFGLDKIKNSKKSGEGEQQGMVRCASLQEFIIQNPSMTEKAIEPFVKLGMFSKTWATRVDTCGGNRHKMLSWLRTYYDDVHNFMKADEKVVAATETMKSSAEDSQEYKKALQSLNMWAPKRAAAKAKLNEAFAADVESRHGGMRETIDEIIEDRGWEEELLSTVFTVQESLKILQGAPNSRTLADLAKTQDELYGDTELYIPVAVLSVSEQKRTKKGSAYYEVRLMDREGNIATRRFDQPLGVTEGAFLLPIDSCKYYTARARSYKALTRAQTRPPVPMKDMAPEQVREEVAHGGKITVTRNDGKAQTLVVPSGYEDP